MSLSDMAVFDQYVMPATIETLGQNIELFNAASNGSIVLTSEGFDGDFLQESFWQGIHAAQRRVDRYAAQGTPSATDLTQDQHNTVKIAGGFGPILFEPGQLTWLRKPTAEGIEVISRNLAEAMLSDMVNTSVSALVAAIIEAGHTADDAGAIDYDLINQAHAVFGDKSSLIIANVMSGAMFHSLIALNLANADTLFEAGNVTVVDWLGRAIVVTDAPSLTVVAGKTSVLGLVANAATVTDAGDLISNVQTTNGKDRIETTFQVDYTFGLGLKGYAWDMANGGKSPLDAEIATGTNWDQVAADLKHTAGVAATFTTP
jgi:hypothetical protein